MKAEKIGVFFFIYFLPLLFGAEISWKADLKEPWILSIALESEKITLDEMIHLNAEISYPADYDLNEEELLDHLKWTANPLSPLFSVLKSDISTLSSKAGIQVKKLQAVIRPLKTGPLDLSFLDIEWTSKESNKAPIKVATPVFTIQVSEAPSSEELSYAPLIPLAPEFPMGLTEANRQFLLEDPQRIEAEKKQMQSVLERHAFPWLTITILLGLGAIAWVAFLTRDRWPKRKEKPLIKLSPKEQADQSLKALNGQNLLEKKLFQKDYTDLSSIVLNALEGNLGWNTKEMTTEELTQAFKKDLLLKKEQKQEIVFILTELDRVKFAKKEPSLEEAQGMHGRIQKLVDAMDSP